MKDWFTQLNQREQLSLLLLTLALGSYLLFVVVWSPLIDMRDEMADRNKGVAEQLQRVEALVWEVGQLRNLGVDHGGRRNLTALINQSTRRLNLGIRRFQPNSRGEIQVRLESTSFDNMMRWLYEMEYEEGLLVREVSVTPTSDAGLINATVRIAQGA
ncbi:MAG: type II secretion system protein M [Halieaceae bacterium]|nr:type II secretion system protein M [Halieaceae bacterium]